MKTKTLLVLFGLLLGALSASAADARKKIVMLISEPEYDTAKTLPEFAAKFLAKDFRVVVVNGMAAPNDNAFDKIQEVADADVLLISARRRTPPKEQFEVIRRYLAAGKPVVGIRTASHAFVLRNGKPAEGLADWPDWDAKVIGGSYTNHYGKGPIATMTAATPAHPILRGVKLPFTSDATLYQSNPLRTGAQALLTGMIAEKPAESVAWTFTRPDGGRTFYTSLGAPSDFQNASFTQLLQNGIAWAAGTLPAK